MLTHEGEYFYFGERLMPFSEENPHSIYNLGLTVRAFNCLRAAGIWNIHRVNAMTDTELLNLPWCGMVTLRDIRTQIAAYEASQQPIRPWLNVRRIPRAHH